MDEERQDPIAKRLIEAQSRFDHEAAATQFNSRGLRVRPTWKGNHRLCEHGTGTCDANEGWQVSYDRLERGEYPFTRIVIEMSTERRAFQQVEYPEKFDIDPEPLWAAKGFLDDRKVKDAAKIRPNEKVVAKLRERYEKEVVETLKHGGAKHAELEAAKKDIREKFAVALNEKPIAKAKAS